MTIQVTIAMVAHQFGEVEVLKGDIVYATLKNGDKWSGYVSSGDEIKIREKAEVVDNGPTCVPDSGS